MSRPQGWDPEHLMTILLTRVIKNKKSFRL